MQAPLHMGLSFVVTQFNMTPWLATMAAVLIAAGSTAETTGGTLNRLRSVEDQFAERSVGLYLNGLSGPLFLGGVGALLVGVLRG